MLKCIDEREHRVLECVWTGTYHVGKPLISIDHFKSTLQVIDSKQRPRRLSIFGSDGRAYDFLLKGTVLKRILWSSGREGCVENSPCWRTVLSKQTQWHDCVRCVGHLMHGMECKWVMDGDETSQDIHAPGSLRAQAMMWLSQRMYSSLESMKRATSLHRASSVWIFGWSCVRMLYIAAGLTMVRAFECRPHISLSLVLHWLLVFIGVRRPRRFATRRACDAAVWTCQHSVQTRSGDPKARSRVWFVLSRALLDFSKNIDWATFCKNGCSVAV